MHSIVRSDWPVGVLSQLNESDNYKRHSEFHYSESKNRPVKVWVIWEIQKKDWLFYMYMLDQTFKQFHIGFTLVVWN